MTFPLTRTTFLACLFLLSGPAAAWYAESGATISGVGAYDRSKTVYLLVAFSGSDRCESASLYLDRAVSPNSTPASPSLTTVDLRVDTNPVETIPLVPVELYHWVPDTTAFTNVVTTDLIQQIRWGDDLVISSGETRFSWSLRGSNQAILAAYQTCIDYLI